MITCFIRYEIEPTQRRISRPMPATGVRRFRAAGADLIGYFAPHEGSSTLAYGVYSVPSLAAYEDYRAKLAADPLGRENYDFAMQRKFIRREDRTFLRLASAPHGKP